MGNTTTRNFSVCIIKTVFKATLLRLFSAKESGPKVWCAMVRDENPKHMKLTSKQKCTNSKLYYHKLCVHHNPTTHARDVSKVNFASSDFFFCARYWPSSYLYFYWQCCKTIDSCVVLCIVKL